jgi:multicomponent Na+:H+ antiporter subunit D
MTSSLPFFASVPPGLILIAGAFLLPFLKGGMRSGAILLLPLATLWLVWQIPDGTTLAVPFLDYTLEIVRGDRLSRLFATIFAIMAFAGGLFALNRESVVELVAAYAYAGSAIGVTFAGDLITVFVFWEMMALGSTLVIWSAGTKESWRAGMRYVTIHLLGGVLLMAGIIVHISTTGSPSWGDAPIHEVLGGGPGTWLILAGFLINAGAPPLSAWLPDAYPEGSYSGTVFLSAFTTKTAVYVLIRGFEGFDVLVYIGLYMVFYGIVYALLENDMRRILAYSIINQVGFMVTGIGIGGDLAVNGAAAHAFTHIIYKALLLMSAGSVFFMTGKRKCTDLGGLFQSMPITTICGIVGALSISSFPLTSGFVSKSMISQAAADGHLVIIWFLLAAASAGVFLHAGIKFPWFVFFQKDSGLRPPDPPLNMRLAMILFTVLCIGIGVWPEPLYNILPRPVDYVPYTGAHVVEMLQLLLFSGLAFFIMLPFMKRTLTITLDVDWFYRWLGPRLIRVALALGAPLDSHARRTALKRLDRFIAGIFRHHGPEGILARTMTTGNTVLWVAILLVGYLVFYYL